jgi:hypothetical protein
MKNPIIPALALTILQNTASAAPGTATGPTAIAQHSPTVRAFDKRVIARLFRGNTRFGFTPKTKISVDADSVVCRVTDVDITSRSQLWFAETHADRARSQRTSRRSLPGSRRLKHRKRLEVAVHDRSEPCTLRRRAVDVFAYSKRKALAAKIASIDRGKNLNVWLLGS